MNIIRGTKIRVIINLISVATMLVAIYFLWLDHLFVFSTLLILGATFFLPREVYQKLGLREKFSNELLDLLEILFSSLVLLSVGGYIWIYDNVYNYDAYVHFITPLLLFLVVALFLSAISRKLKMNYDKSDIILGSIVIMMSLILIWEVFEYLITLAGANMFYQEGQANDSLYDILAGFLSLPVGSVLVYKYNDWFLDQVKKSPSVYLKKDSKKYQ